MMGARCEHHILRPSCSLFCQRPRVENSPGQDLIEATNPNANRAFSLLQNKDGSIKTRDQLAFMQKNLTRNKRLGAVLIVGALAIHVGPAIAINAVSALGLGGTISLLSFVKVAPLTIIMLLLAAVAYPEAAARHKEIQPYVNGSLPIPSSIDKLVEVSSFARLEQRLKNTSRIGILTALLIPAYMFISIADFVIPALASGASTAVANFGVFAAIFFVIVSVAVFWFKRAQDRKDIAALEHHYHTIRAKIEHDANLEGGLSAPGPDPTAMTGGLSMTHHTDGALTETKE